MAFPAAKTLLLLFVVLLVVAEVSQAIAEVWQLTRMNQRQQRHHRERNGHTVPPKDNWTDKLQQIRHKFSMLSHRLEKQIGHRTEQVVENGVPKMDRHRLNEQLQQQGKQSVQMCIFLRVSCTKISHRNYSQRLNDFLNGLMVQERARKGMIIHRKPSEQ